ncbi:hypothetical protein D9619_000576 [Psilocybe cf. subviscida]|uniref:Anaphase-promoting complex subunit 4-like WD40 domain-containing protein n=1 Tax=Psilocybe cf. subviscida TaxID=2480587 RepID=A0A8H5F2Y2_9AGAR|nr:hypothetical protein D9619_000576 [Psilocybe cf. subviscida]
MSSQAPPPALSKEEVDQDVPIPDRPRSPPLHTTFAARNITPPNFSAFKPRDTRIASSHAMTHVAWSCDGKKLAAVGIDKITRVWDSNKPIELRNTTSTFSGGHLDDVDYISWNPTHPELFCTSSSRDRRVVFWDARQSRHIQMVTLKNSPTKTSYAPDGRSVLYTTSGHNFGFLALGKKGDGPKEEWGLSPKDLKVGSTARFNNSGDSIVVSHYSESSLMVLDCESLTTMRSQVSAHMGGCVALAMDPRGKYLASGGFNSIINLYDLRNWIAVRSITVCDHGINDLNFSFDGEYLAVANEGNYIDICAVETGDSLHRIPALAPSPTVSWHPSKYAIAYCGQTKYREAGPAQAAVISTFGVLDY